MAARFGVQTFVIGAGALVLGLVLGGLGPRSELRAAQQELFDQQKKCANSAGSAAGVEFAKLLGQSMEQRRADKAASAASGGAPGDVGPLTVEGGPEGSDGATGSGKPRQPGDDGGSAEQIEAAKEMLALRSHQARAALIEDADPSADQLKLIDQTLADMNQALLASARDFADRSLAEGTMSRRDVMSFGADSLSLLVDAEDRLLGALTPDQRAAVRDEATDPTSFVDPQIVSIFEEIQGLDDPGAAP